MLENNLKMGEERGKKWKFRQNNVQEHCSGYSQ